MFFGVKAVLAKSFARIHRDNLINYAVLPLAFSDAADYDALDPEDQLEITRVAAAPGGRGDAYPGLQPHQTDDVRNLPRTH